MESRLSSSCPSLAIESGAEGETRETPRRRGRGGGGHGKAGHRATGNGGQRRAAARSGRVRSPSESTGESDEEEGRGEVRAGGGGGHNHHQHHPGSRQMMGEGMMLAHGGVEGSPVGSGGALHKSVSTPSMAQGELATQHASATKSR